MEDSGNATIKLIDQSMAGIGNTLSPYHIYEQIHDVLITNSQTYSITRISMLCPSGVIVLDDRLALPSECLYQLLSSHLDYCFV